MPLEHKVATAIAGLFDRIHIHRPFDHAQQRVVAARVGALGAQFLFGQGPALTAVPNTFHSLAQGLGQAQAATAVAL